MNFYFYFQYGLPFAVVGLNPTLLLLFNRFVSKSLRNRGLQHPRLHYPSLSPEVCSNSCPLSQWCNPIISHSFTPFSLFPQSFQHQGLFQWVSSLQQVAKVLKLQLHHQSSNQYTGWYPLKLTGLISLLSKGLSRVFSCTTIRKHQFFGAHPSLWSNSYICSWLLEKNIALTV